MATDHDNIIAILNIFMTSIIVTIISNICAFFLNVSEYFKNRSQNKELYEAEKNRKLQNEKDEHLQIIEDAIKEGDLDEIRKHASE
jgi:hypoxanthine-guanine phosphoribosyltransferase